MLTITREAADAIDAVVRSAPDAPETAGLRITRSATPEGEAGLEMSVADGPAAGDAIVEAEGTTVYLETEAAELLDDKVLDAHLHGDHVHFELRDQDQPG